MAPHVARLLREIYSRGPVVTLEIEENIIATIMELIFIKGTRSAPSIPMEGKVEFLKVLEEVMLVSIESLRAKLLISFINFFSFLFFPFLLFFFL